MVELRKALITLNGRVLAEFPQIQQDGRSSDGGHGSSDQEPPVDGLYVFGTVQVSLVSRQYGKDAAQDGQGGHSGGTEDT